MATNPDELFADLMPGSKAGAVYGPPPKPAEPKEQPESWHTLSPSEAEAAGYSPGKIWQVSSRGNAKAVGDTSAEATLTPQDKEELKAEALSKLRLGASLIKRSREGWFTTGFGAKALSAVSESSPAGAVAADTETLKNAGALQRVIELSKKTGKNPLTPLSNSDFQALANSISNLSTGQPDEQYQRNVGTLLDIYKRTYLAAGGAQADIDKILNSAGTGNDVTMPSGATPENGGGGSGGGGNSPPPGIGRLTDAQQAAFAQFMRTDPNEAQVASFLQGFTNKPVTNAAQILQHYKRTGQVSGTVEDLSAKQRIRQRIDAENRLGVGSDAATTLATQGGTLNLSDEAAGVGNALAGLVTGSPDVGENYRFGRDVERQRIADARQQLGYGGTALEVVSGAASAGPGRLIGPMTPAVARRAGGVAGAIGGALAGFGAGEGLEQSAAGAAGGAAVGGALGRYGPSAVERVLPRRLRPSPQMAPDVARAADAEGVDLIRPMVDPNAVSDYGALESNVYSQPIIRGAAGRVRGQIEDRAVALGQNGTPLEPDAAGGLVQGAGRRFIQRSRNIANRLYDRARQQAGNTRFEPTQAIAQVDNELAQLQANPETNAGEITFLEGLRRDLAAPGGKTVEELRQLRTSLRGRVNEQSLGATQAEARAIRAMDATQQDVASAVPAAAHAYRRADSFYRERQTHVDDIIQRITGGNVGGGNFQVSGEQAFQRLRSMTSPGGDGRRLAALMRDLEPNERQDIAATIAQGLGRRSPDEPFSTALFISQTRKLSPSARRTIFGPDGAQSIDNLRLLSQRLETAERDINRSRSATVLERQGWRNAARAVISGLAGMGGTAATGSFAGGAAGVAVAAGAMGASAARKVLSARAMVNPRVSRWLADTVNVQTRQQAAAAVRRLGSIIAREPALAHELQPIYDSLTSRVTQPLAAQPSGQDDAGGQ